MTRKQALSLAIQALSEKGNTEAAEVLHTLAQELPLVNWSDASIRDAVEQFILDRGRPPKVTDFKRRGLPPHTVIRLHYGVTLKAWLAENYPIPKPDREAEKQAATEAFLRDYERIQPKSADDFNKRRSPGTCCWYTIAAYHGTKTWRGLIDKLDLPVYSRIKRPHDPAGFKVRVYTHYDFRD